MGQNRQEKSLQVPYKLLEAEMPGKDPGGKDQNRPAAVMFSFGLVFAEHTHFNKQVKAHPKRLQNVQVKCMSSGGCQVYLLTHPILQHVRIYTLMQPQARAVFFEVCRKQVFKELKDKHHVCLQKGSIQEILGPLVQFLSLE